ncbi:hypothetical protein FB45DRAFT_846944 [Roridomyces roridus]|uniref:Uncharacterized protein n=1 Tax=Roridomyces roridus TaxID=1738132 RepID=A0AAD7B1V8_9AGAR|nr:hypothetical protein FB45DRAFT_846944 [Roridomyces roridus]
MIVPQAKDSQSPEAPMEAPPAYDTAEASSSSSRPAPVEKVSPRSPTSPSSSTVKPRGVQKSTWNHLQDDMGGLLVGMGLGTTQYRVAQEVRKTVTGLIHDLVRDQTIDSNMACDGILESCNEICVAHSIDIASLLQRAYIEGHTPLYWAIVKRPTDQLEPKDLEPPPLIRALLRYSAPLRDATLRDVRLACLHNCDQWLFQSLRMSPEFGALSHKDQLLLGVQVPPDTLKIGEPARHDAPFSVEFEVAHFQKRMRISRLVTLDFISHARMWQITFFIADGDWGLNDGEWAARLSLLNPSPPTTVQATYTLDLHAPEDDVPEKLELTGKLEADDKNLSAALPDAVQYPRSPFLTSEGNLRGTLTVQITQKK